MIKCENLDSGNNFVSYESEFYYELWFIFKTGKLGFVSRQCFKFRICSKNGKPNIVLKTVKSFNITGTYLKKI